MKESKTRGFVVINSEECKGCALCIEVCQGGCLSLSDHLNHQGYHPVQYSGEGCLADGLCFYACPEPGAITVFQGKPEQTAAEDRRDAATA
jgi:NAD-dependent dihydropyrimidine dehydrogenase PreA subunit